ncbi:MAG: RNA-binding protein [Dehalococcoidia bacterium]|nr:RNA-binding protein [Dehalococcoidia bacterium]MQF98723.1 RNA-binding protein [SAR202 cluster bacterium]
MRIYVGNLSYQATEQELRDTFEAHGEVEETYIVRDRDTGRSRGFAFVEMPTDDEAKAAIEDLNGKEVGGRTLTVNEARPRQERSPGSGSRW